MLFEFSPLPCFHFSCCFKLIPLVFFAWKERFGRWVSRTVFMDITMISVGELAYSSFSSLLSYFLFSFFFFFFRGQVITPSLFSQISSFLYILEGSITYYYSFFSSFFFLFLRLGPESRRGEERVSGEQIVGRDGNT